MVNMWVHPLLAHAYWWFLFWQTKQYDETTRTVMLLAVWGLMVQQLLGKSMSASSALLAHAYWWFYSGKQINMMRQQELWWYLLCEDLWHSNCMVNPWGILSWHMHIIEDSILVDQTIWCNNNNCAAACCVRIYGSATHECWFYSCQQKLWNNNMRCCCWSYCLATND